MEDTKYKGTAFEPWNGYVDCGGNDLNCFLGKVGSIQCRNLWIENENVMVGNTTEFVTGDYRTVCTCTVAFGLTGETCDTSSTLTMVAAVLNVLPALIGLLFVFPAILNLFRLVKTSWGTKNFFNASNFVQFTLTIAFVNDITFGFTHAYATLERSTNNFLLLLKLITTTFVFSALNLSVIASAWLTVVRGMRKMKSKNESRVSLQMKVQIGSLLLNIGLGALLLLRLFAFDYPTAALIAMFIALNPTVSLLYLIGQLAKDMQGSSQSKGSTSEFLTRSKTFRTRLMVLIFVQCTMYLGYNIVNNAGIIDPRKPGTVVLMVSIVGLMFACITLVNGILFKFLTAKSAEKYRRVSSMHSNKTSIDPSTKAASSVKG